MAEEKEATGSNANIKVEKLFSDADIAALDEVSQQLAKHKCKFTVGKDGKNVTFYPSPHLYDAEGNFDVTSLKNRGTSDMNSACSLVAGQSNCDAVEAAFTDEIEKYKNVRVMAWRGNNFVHAAETAWADHYPLKMEPSHIWLLILQAVALHVDQNAEALRKKWVLHEGKKQLVVIRDDFVKGARESNKWSEVIGEFCEQIDKNTVENTVKLLESNFSNASVTDKVATKVTIMDICKNYFRYMVMTCCGFPSITLTGTKDDWIKIYNKAEKLLETKVDTKFGQNWAKALLPVLARFVSAFDGDIDCLFWNSMIKRGAHRGSGGFEFYSGWINIFFPIIKNRDSRYCVPYSPSVDYIVSGLKEARHGNDINYYPNGLATAPVTWKYFNVELKLKFIAGFVGVTQDKDSKELSPMVGWVIGEQTKENTQAVAAIKDEMKKATDTMKTA